MVPQSGTIHATEHSNFGSGWTGIATSVWSKHVGGIILDLTAPVLLDWSGQHVQLHQDHTCSGWTAYRWFKTYVQHVTVRWNAF